MPAIDGVQLVSFASGSRYRDRDDLLLAKFASTTTAAGVFTQSSMPSAAVDLCRQNLSLSKGKASALIVNAGIANAFTGKAGARAADDVVASAASILSVPEDAIYMASTGVIGEDLDPAPLVQSLMGAPDLLSNSARASSKSAKVTSKQWRLAAEAILTTDTYAKFATRQVKFGREQVTINLIAKGSGMIAPDMATMLGFAFTDAAIPAGVLQKILDEVNPQSFSAITVDSDTSTSDSLMIFATGAKKIGGAAIRSAKDARLKGFKNALLSVMQEVAIQVASDGEGATKLMTIDVRGAADDAAARRIGLAVGNSPLVKTAVAGEDANWGRIVMAIGKSGERADRDSLSIHIGGHKVAHRGRAIAGFDEAPIAKHMKGQQIHFDINVGVKGGKGHARIWACDLTHGYISINADYRS
ncbi:bifunctional glutamate N-acetyltransferase/amino-acid acetyltransferase ArgJ [Alphaproteobacteria bacterium]|nr:bifunctional glutamate N-acetyltransferase/amino-acid acetyltransferase ArgJ [Alphaproteobacteria bacterium]